MQARSQRRREAIVLAAAESFAQFGFGDTTMEGIAARAGTSIGSVYQFFPNKHAVFREIAGRCLLEARRSYASLVGADALQVPWATLLGRVIDGFRALHDGSAMMQAMWRNLELYGEYAEADQAMMRELIAATAVLFGAWVPSMAEPTRRVIATMVVNTVATTLLVIAREPDRGRADALVVETKRMLERYLASYLPG